MFVPSSLRSASLLHFLLFNPKQKEKHQEHFEFLPLSPSSFSGLATPRATSTPSLALGNPPPFPERGYRPTARRAESTVKKYGVVGETLQQGKLLNGELFQQRACPQARQPTAPCATPAFREPRLARGWLSATSTATGGDGPGPIVRHFVLMKTNRQSSACSCAPSCARDWRTLTPATASLCVADRCQARALTGNGGLTLSTHMRRTLTPADLLGLEAVAGQSAYCIIGGLNRCCVCVQPSFSDASSSPFREKLQGGLLGGFMPVKCVHAESAFLRSSSKRESEPRA